MGIYPIELLRPVSQIEGHLTMLLYYAKRHLNTYKVYACLCCCTDCYRFRIDAHPSGLPAFGFATGNHYTSLPPPVLLDLRQFLSVHIDFVSFVASDLMSWYPEDHEIPGGYRHFPSSSIFQNDFAVVFVFVIVAGPYCVNLLGERLQDQS